jgi:hypothetical protein
VSRRISVLNLHVDDVVVTLALDQLARRIDAGAR